MKGLRQFAQKVACLGVDMADKEVSLRALKNVNEFIAEMNSWEAGRI